jgi:Mrp family chromosome partitioning ATPase
MPDNPEHVPVIAVASGKGGVGKTTVAVKPDAAPCAHAARRRGRGREHERPGVP